MFSQVLFYSTICFCVNFFTSPATENAFSRFCRRISFLTKGKLDSVIKGLFFKHFGKRWVSFFFEIVTQLHIATDAQINIVCFFNSGNFCIKPLCGKLTVFILRARIFHMFLCYHKWRFSSIFIAGTLLFFYQHNYISLNTSSIF